MSVSPSANVRGLDHVELYVEDVREAASRMCASFGFRSGPGDALGMGPAAQRSVVLTQGDMRILLTPASAAGDPPGEYVSRHGDGVAAIALVAEDTSRAFACAIRHGAKPVQEPVEYEQDAGTVIVATVSGFGDVVHRLVERHEPASGSGQAGDAGSGSRGDGDLLRAIDHLAVCLPAGDLHPTVRFYQEAFGFSQIFEERIEVGDQTMYSAVVQDQARDVTLTLLEPGPGAPGQIDDFLRRHGGAGVQHLAFETSDIAGAVRTFQNRGVHFLATPASYYEHLERRLGRPDMAIDTLRELNILADRDHHGQMFQIFTKSTHDRQTFFVELIERHGATSFGSANIRALYEAVERSSAGQRLNA
jgi:4-hydroxymandelate synthase